MAVSSQGDVVRDVRGTVVVYQPHQLGVQRQVTVFAELADRDV